jgi:hypothetical protein
MHVVRGVDECESLAHALDDLEHIPVVWGRVNKTAGMRACDACSMV